VVGEEGPDLISRYYLFDPAGLTGAGVPDHQFGQVISKSPPSTTQVSRGLNTPFSDELTLGFEREIAPEVAISLTYINRRFRRQLQDRDVNHTLRLDPSTGLPLDKIGALKQGGAGASLLPDVPVPDGRPDLFIQDYFFNQVLRIGNYNEARYHALELSVLRRLSRRWEMQGSYTYSRAVGDAEDFQSRLGNDPSTIQAEFGYLDYDQRHVVKMNALMFLPHDWQLGIAATWGSGLPYSIVSRFFALDNVGYPQFRTLYGYTALQGNQFQFVTLRRNSFRNASTYDFNLRASKTVVLAHKAASVFFEVFNLLNSDDLRVFTYEPVKITRFDPSDPASGTPLQLDAQRRFGRRWQIGIQFEF